MRRRILLVDDEVAVLLTLKAVLEISGFEVDTAASAREGVSKLHTREYQMLITDMRMEHDVAGVEVIKAARAAQYHPAVALLTAFPLAEEDWQEMGADQLLVKPVHTRILLQQIEDLINSHERKLASLGIAAAAEETPAPVAAKRVPTEKVPVKKVPGKNLPHGGRKQRKSFSRKLRSQRKSQKKLVRRRLRRDQQRRSSARQNRLHEKQQSPPPRARPRPRCDEKNPRSTARDLILACGVFLDVGTQREVQAHCLLHAIVQHPQPIGRGFFHLDGTQKVAGLDNDLESVAQVVGDPAHLN